MSPENLLIVIPTRNRPDFLERCVRSIFESQANIPTVIVSDNSTIPSAGIDALKRRYPLRYIRQSGNLSATEHFNACFRLQPSKWLWMIHDDDELMPGSIQDLRSFVDFSSDVGIVAGGVDNIGPEGELLHRWVPKHTGSYRGEEGLLRLGLDFCLFSPNTVFNVEATRAVGGFVEINGYPADYTLCVRLAHSSGVAFWSGIVGRCRHGPHQDSDYSTPAKAEAWLALTVRMAEEVCRTTGCSVSAAERLIDYRTWSVFWIIVRWLDSDPSFVFRVCQKYMRQSPPYGKWRKRVSESHPFLFSKLGWYLWCQKNSLKAVLPAPVIEWLRTARQSLQEQDNK